MACRGFHGVTLRRELGTGSPGSRMPALPCPARGPQALASSLPHSTPRKPLGGPYLREAPLETVKE